MKDKSDRNPESRRKSAKTGGKGRRDEVGRSGVYPMSGPHPPSPDAPIIPEPAWGQGARGAAGYDDHGSSELTIGEDKVMPEKCRDIMTKNPVCCAPQDTVQRIAQLMRDKDVGPVPICRDPESKHLVGIVTDRDLALKVIAEGRDPKTTRAEQVMTRNPVACSPDDDIEAALDLMETHQVRRIAVCDNQGRIVGIIAQADIATRARQPGKTAEVVEEISRPRAAATGA